MCPFNNTESHLGKLFFFLLCIVSKALICICGCVCMCMCVISYAIRHRKIKIQSNEHRASTGCKLYKVPCFQLWSLCCLASHSILILLCKHNGHFVNHFICMCNSIPSAIFRVLCIALYDIELAGLWNHNSSVCNTTQVS